MKQFKVRSGKVKDCVLVEKKLPSGRGSVWFYVTEKQHKLGNDYLVAHSNEAGDIVELAKGCTVHIEFINTK